MYRCIRKLAKLIIKGYLRDAFWQIYGKTLRNPPTPKSPKTITFICKGNICRSPFAQYIAEQISMHSEQPEYRFLSAGIEVKPSTPPPKAAVEAAAKFGISMENHRSCPFDREMMRHSEMVFAMETWQFKALRKKNILRIKSVFSCHHSLKNPNWFCGKGSQPIILPIHMKKAYQFLLTVIHEWKCVIET